MSPPRKRSKVRRIMRRTETFQVKLPVRGSSGYPITIGPGALELVPKTISSIGRPSRLHVISDSNVWRLWGKKLWTILERMEIPLSRTVVPAGERSKSMKTLDTIWRQLMRAGCDRRAWVVAFGGGVVGDLAGFAAASILRGVDFLQIPTTLLAMVDSSVGGKTGINLPEGKNLVGAFHQPRAVVIDLDLLRTLPAREMRAGWAEVIKTAAIRDERLFRYLEIEKKRLLRRHPSGMQHVVSACARIKADVVRRDEREGGLRMILNFGHTLAHAIEAGRGYGKLLHGEAVSIGMVFATRFGEARRLSARGVAERMEKLLKVYGLPVSLKGMPPRMLLRAMELDKKRGPRGLRWVFLDCIGRARIHEDIPWDVSRLAIQKFTTGE